MYQVTVLCSKLMNSATKFSNFKTLFTLISNVSGKTIDIIVYSRYSIFMVEFNLVHCIWKMSFLFYGHSQCKIRFYIITSLFYLSSKILHVHNMLKTPQSCLGVKKNKVLHSIVLTKYFHMWLKLALSTNQSINQSIN